MLQGHLFAVRRRASTAALATAALASAAYAQSPAAEQPPVQQSSPATDRTDTARKASSREHIRLGTLAFEKKNYSLAINELRAAYDDSPDPSILYALGQAYRMSGDCAHAREAYARFLESKPAEKHRDATVANMERCASAPTAPAQSGATKKPPPADPSGPPALGGTTITTAVSPGVRAAPPAPPVPDRRPWYLDVPGGVLTGAGVVSAVAGTVLFAGGRSKVSSADSATDDGTFGDTRGGAEAGLNQQRVGLVFLGVGAALATAGVIRYVTVNRRSDHASVRVSPALGGILATGTF